MTISFDASAYASDSPVALLPGEAVRSAEPGIGLCLSGGGYRAMLFHLGALLRLNELGYLSKLARISSVSGGSITAGVLGLKWGRLEFVGGIARNFEAEVVEPIRGLAGETIDTSAILSGTFLPGTIGEKVTAAYRKHLFGDATLQALPDRPRFVINASNVQSGVLLRFSKPYLRDYRVGELRSPEVELAVAVAASSAFPPFLSPVELELDPAKFTPGSGLDLQREPFTSKLILTDGGVYDNLGLETVWKRYETILVSDAGGTLGVEEHPNEDWPRHMYRVLFLIDGQVRALRKRQLIDAFKRGARKGAYWGVRSNLASYGFADSPDVPRQKSVELANTPTRLKSLPDDVQIGLIAWGRVICDAALRRHVIPNP